MSASRERKMRTEQGVPFDAPQKKKKKLSEGAIFAICVIVVVALLLGGLFGYRAFQRNRTVLTVGPEKISATDFNYFYNNVVSSISSYYTFFGIQAGVALDKQNVTTSGSTNLGLFGIDSSYLTTHTPDAEGNYDVTWAQLLAYNAMNSAVQVYAVYNEAVAAGYQLDADVVAELDEEVANISAAATTYGYSDADAYIESIFGSNTSVAGYRNYLEVTHIATNYVQSLNYTESELDARYAESPESFDAVSYYCYRVNSSAFAEKNEDGTTAEVTKANRLAAKAAAEAMLADFQTEIPEDNEDEKGTVTLYADYLRSNVTSGISEEAATWLFDEASAGDVKYFEGTVAEGAEDPDSYFVIQLIDKEDYQTVDVLEIYVANDAEDAELGEGELTAEEKVAAVEAALAADDSRESFTSLIAEYSSEEGDGVVEGMSRSTMNNVSKDVLNWCSLERRAEGDWQKFEVNGGTIFLYFTGLNNTHRHSAVTSTLRSEWVTEKTEAALAVCGYDEDAAMAANVDLAFNATSTS